MNERRPILLLIKEAGLTLYSIRPYLACLTYSTMASGLTRVPLLTLGNRPLGPNILAYCFSSCSWSWAAISLSKSTLLSAISSRIYLVPIISAPTASSSAWKSEAANTQTLTSLPVPDGRTQVPRIIWSPLVGSTLSFTHNSTLSANFLSFDTFWTWSKISSG